MHRQEENTRTGDLDKKSGWAKIETCIIFLPNIPLSIFIVQCLKNISQLFVMSFILKRKLKVCEPVFGRSHAIVAIFALFAIYATLQDLSVLAGRTIKC